MSVFNEFPYTNIHELNLDWILAKVKELATEWLQVHTEFETMQQLVNGLEEYIHDYFENLDIQEEVDIKLDEMAGDGSLLALVRPVMIAYISSWLGDAITNPANPPLDNTLMLSNAAAESRAAGNRIRNLENVLTLVPTGQNLANPNTLSTGRILADGTLANESFYTTDFIPLSNNGEVWRVSAWNPDDTRGTNVIISKEYYDALMQPVPEAYKSQSFSLGFDTINNVDYSYIRVSVPAAYKILVDYGSTPAPSTWHDYTQKYVMEGELGQDALDQIATYFGLTPVNP